MCSFLCLINSSKAVADCAVIWSIISSVFFRAPCSSFGITCSRLFENDFPEHQGCTSSIFADGRERVSGCWKQVVTKVCAWVVVLHQNTYHNYVRGYHRMLKQSAVGDFLGSMVLQHQTSVCLQISYFHIPMKTNQNGH